KPSCSPKTLYPSFKNAFATVLMTEFMPGAGPPPQRINMDLFFGMNISFKESYIDYMELPCNSTRGITSHKFVHFINCHQIGIAFDGVLQTGRCYGKIQGILVIVWIG